MTILGALGWFLFIFIVYPILCLMVIGVGVEVGFEEPVMFQPRGWGVLTLKIIGWIFILPLVTAAACWWGSFLYGRYLFTGDKNPPYEIDIPQFIMEIWEW